MHVILKQGSSDSASVRSLIDHEVPQINNRLAELEENVRDLDDLQNRIETLEEVANATSSGSGGSGGSSGVTRNNIRNLNQKVSISTSRFQRDLVPLNRT